MRSSRRRSRREFLGETLALAVAGAGATRCLAAESGSPVKGGWPIACRDAILRDCCEGDIWSAMRAVGVDGMEATVNMERSLPLLASGGKTPSIGDASGVRLLGDELKRQGKAITAFCLHNQFDQRPEQETELTIATGRVAATMGIPAVRIDLVPQKMMDRQEYLAFAVRIGRAIVEGTEGLNVRFGLENHGTTTNQPEFLRKLFEGIGSKRFGLTLDLGNFYWYGHPLSKVYEYFAEFAPWVCHVHCKSIRYPEADRERQRDPGWKYAEYRCPLYEGDIDYRRAAEILRKSGFKGDLCIDDESLGLFPKARRPEVLKRIVGYLREVSFMQDQKRREG